MQTIARPLPQRQFGVCLLDFESCVSSEAQREEGRQATGLARTRRPRGGPGARALPLAGVGACGPAARGHRGPPGDRAWDDERGQPRSAQAYALVV